MQTTCYPRRPFQIAASPPETAAAQPRLSRVTSRPGDWHYDGLPKPARICWSAVLLSAGLHGLLLGELGVRPAKRPVAAVPVERIIQMVMPPLADDEEKPVEELPEEADQTPGVDVPRLADLPSSVELANAFVQPLEMNIALQTNFDKNSLRSIPLKIAPPGQRPGGLKDIFDIAQLDRVPQPIAQPSPQFPYELQKLVEHGQVLVEFIVDTKGVAREVRVLSSTHQGFEQASIEGVNKWRFRPGMKGGAKVNTRMRVPIVFTVIDPET